jgi:hypothetical protein
LSGARFDGCFLGWTVLADIQLQPLCSVTVTHGGPSSVDLATIVRSAGAPGLREFLISAGTPASMADGLLGIVSATPRRAMQSTFISYGAPDEGFAARLNEALRAEGVQTYFFKDHAIPGRQAHREMFEGVNRYDRMILVCSAASLDRPGVLFEIEQAAAREAREGGTSRVIPVRIDDYLFNGWNPPGRPELRQYLIDRVCADFRGTQDDASLFAQQLGSLLRALEHTEE